MKNSQPEDFWPWFAGILDGEGCFHIAKRRNPKNRSNTSYQLQVSLGMCEPYWVPWIHEQLGEGAVYRLRDDDPTHKTYWKLNFYSESLRRILPKLIPHLRVKKHSAEALLEALQLVEKRTDVRHTPELLAKMEALRNRCNGYGTR